MSNYIFQIESNNAEVFKTSIIEAAEMIKAGEIDIKTFATDYKENKNDR